MVSREEISKAVVVAAEVLGHELSPVAATAMARELVGFEHAHVSAALRRCVRELRGRLTLADILQRMPGQHPSAEEAWALCPRDEAQTVVWTDAIAEAFGVARPLLRDGDEVGARMAFRSAYSRIVAEDHGSAPKWWPSIGHDVHGRARPLLAAVEAGRLPADFVRQHIEALPGGEESLRRLSGGDSTIGSLLAGVGEDLRRAK
jgi:hypothetical protein